MKKVIFVSISAIFLIVGMVSIAEAATASTWNVKPEDNAYGWDGGVAANGYSRDMYWDFESSPWKLSGTDIPPNVVYPDIAKPYNNDTSLRGNDLIINTGDVKQQTINGGNRIGVLGPTTGTKASRTGTAEFTLANLSIDKPQQYIWMEFDAGVNHGDVSVSLKDITGKTITSHGAGTVLSNSSGASSGTYNTWFKIETFPNNTPETIVFTFNAASGHDGFYAYIDNLRVATSPEPISAALFLTGAGVLALRKRMKRGMVLA